MPDIALDAQPNTGYIIDVHVGGLPLPERHPLVPGRRHQRRRAADGRHHGRREHLLAVARRPADGIREPAALQRPDLFWDITQGSNSINGSGLYKAAVGYDPATGLGSPKADALATALAAFTPAAVSPDATNLDVTSPTATKTVKYGRQVTLAGTLTDSSDTPIANRRVYVELREGNRIYLYGDQTDSSGVWSFALTKQLRRNLSWQAIFPGSDTQQGLTVAGTTIHVIPRLGSKASRSQRPPRHVVHLRRQVGAEHARRQGAPAGAAKDQRRLAHDRHRRRQPARRLLAQDPLHHPGRRVPALELRRWWIARLDERHLALPARRHHLDPG